MSNSDNSIEEGEARSETCILPSLTGLLIMVSKILKMEMHKYAFERYGYRKKYVIASKCEKSRSYHGTLISVSQYQGDGNHVRLFS